MTTPVPSELAEAELRNDRGHGFAARELWRERPALILWVRHFG
jgi:hypothetical protein